MNQPVMDPRTKESLMEQLKLLAQAYTPAWRYEQGDPSDPGAAIVSLFGELFSQTIDRFNQLPGKYYTEFLNLLGVQSPSLNPAAGLVQFEAGAGMGPVAVPAGTEIFAAAPGGGEDVVFATERKIEAVTAQLEDVYYVDAMQNCIQRLDLGREQAFFGPVESPNLQRHRFAFSQNQVLALEGGCEIQVSLRQTPRFLEEGTAQLLADPDCAAWQYYDGSDYVPFDQVQAQDGILVLKKEGGGPLLPEEDGRRYLYCELQPAAKERIQLSGIGLRSRLSAPAAADALFNNDVFIPHGAGGYCFGRRPMPYELFYIRSDNVFCKRGAQVHLRLDVVPIVDDLVGGELQYEFNRRIIDKRDAVRVVPDDVYVEQVAWEYYNGTGWAPMTVGGNENPFSCKQEGPQQMYFTLPEDISPTLVNAQEGYYIRARVIHVANYLSTTPRWLLPFVKGVLCDYQYDRFCPAQSVRAWNNAALTEVEETEGIADLALQVYEPMQPHPRAMYLRFDRSFFAMPLSILFQVVGETLLESKIAFEAYDGEQFFPLRAIDQTQNLRYTGTVFLYLPEPLPQATLFGQEGYWLRMSLSSYGSNPTRTPHVAGLAFNIVRARQYQRGVEQLFSTEAYEAGKTLELLESPVLETDIWVDEMGNLSRPQQEQLEQEHPGGLQLVWENGVVSRCWVRWEPVSNLLLAGPEERVYELDANSGVVHFGNGVNGKVPPRGELNIRVNYTYGGGVRGNLPTGSVNALVGSIPGITGVQNIEPMSGGTDLPPMAKLEALGNRRIRHRDRALGASDFEQMALAKFQRVAHAKCFSNQNPQGEPAPGHVCLVVMGQDFSSESMRYALCQEVYSYLAPRADCNLVASGRFHVIPSTEVMVNVHVQVQMHDLDAAALTQRELADHIAELIDRTWRGREIGNQIHLNELYRTIKAVPNVKSVGQVLCEGSYYKQGRRCLCALEDDFSVPYATVRSGHHTIQIG